MKLKEFVSNIFNYRIKNGDEGWDEAIENLRRNGQWSITGSPKKFELMFTELLKRVEKLEEHGGSN